MKRSFRVSNDFINKLLFLQEQTKAEGLALTQEQILDEMMEIYLIYKSKDLQLLNESIEKVLINTNNLFLTKQAQLQNAMFKKIDKNMNDIIELLGKVAK